MTADLFDIALRSSALKKMDDNETLDKVKLSKDQESAAYKILSDLLGGKHCCLQGSAGTGKTYTAGAIVEQLLEYDLVVAACAPTHKAIEVLRESLSDSVPSATVHSLLGLVPVRANGEQKLMVKDARIDKRLQILVVDECSMIGDELFRHISQASITYNFTVLFIGDVYQLPPVMESRSPVFTNNSITKYALDKIHRQAEGSKVIELATAVRDSMVNGTDLPNFADYKGKEVRLYSDLYKWGLKVLKGFKKHDPNDQKLIAYTNAKVLSSAYYIRKERDGYDTREPQKLEVFVANEAISDPDPQNKDEIIINNNQSVVFNDVVENMRGPVKGWDCNVSVMGKDTYDVFVPERIEDLERDLADLKNKALEAKRMKDDRAASEAWRDYYAARNACADLRPSYAQTVHKSQGSGYKTVYLNNHNLQIMARYNAEDYKRALYTAITRTRNKIHIF